MADMAPLEGSRTLDLETRVQDYLNDKLQTVADFESLDSLLQNVQEQHRLLHTQVSVYWNLNYEYD